MPPEPIQETRRSISFIYNTGSASGSSYSTIIALFPTASAVVELRRTPPLRRHPRPPETSLEPAGFFRAAPFRPRAPIPSLPPPSIHSAVPVLDLRSPNPDEIGRIHPISRQTQPQLLVGHAGSTNELLIDVHPAAPPTTVPSLLDSAPPTCRTIGLSSILARVKLATVKMQNSCNSILLQLSGLSFSILNHMYFFEID
ncbi:uncharacterized protein LOC119350223 [Triticum dicoccoides]|uniref:uncharacterized protein LOC119350223 n=1 Tax=Triticum dicoccoides TaxID=85692 RepID=UPI00188FFB0A|nr:uncharacterized protein LOC119350223 [Triticum dicoccoides]